MGTAHCSQICSFRKHQIWKNDKKLVCEKLGFFRLVLPLGYHNNHTNFYFKKTYIKIVHAPICLECCITPDSPHHQVFECPNFQTEFRSSLASSIGNLETNFHLPLLFHTDPNKESGMTVSDSGEITVNCTLCEARKALKHQVKIIFEQSHFKDDLLTVKTLGNQR